MIQILSKTPEQTRRVAARLGRRAKPGDLLWLVGPLGSGKTTFVQGFARGAGFAGNVMSPSFGLVRQYRTRRLTLYHIDLFRVRRWELPNIGLEEYLTDPKGAYLVEWPEVAQEILPKHRMEIRFSHRREGRMLKCLGF